MSEQATTSVFGSERAKSFIDAVVAIAMTLLILPLMESIADIADSERSAAEWFVEHQQQLIRFTVSFVIIGTFWITHHRLFDKVSAVTVGLLWVTMPWLLSIVWLPVATAMSGQLSSDDPLVLTVYIGSMIMTSLLTLVIRLYLLKHPTLHSNPVPLVRRGIAVDLSMATLFGLSLIVAITVPAIGYFALFLMFLTGPVQRLYVKVLTPR